MTRRRLGNALFAVAAIVVALTIVWLLVNGLVGGGTEVETGERTGAPRP